MDGRRMCLAWHPFHLVRVKMAKSSTGDDFFGRRRGTKVAQDAASSNIGPRRRHFWANRRTSE